MHYIGVRDDEGVVQLEHVELARAIKTIFATQFPTVYRAFFEQGRNPLEVENEELKAEIEVLKATLRGKL
jgi:hypothetical protein